MDDKPFDSESRPPRGALREYVVHQLLSAIIMGKIEAGSRLLAKELALQLNVSATPVREAIVELCCLGMVSTHHNKGTHVLEFGPVQLSEFYHMRRMFECETAQLSCGKVPQQTIAQLSAQMAALPAKDDASWLPLATAFDIAVHRTLRDYCGNQRLILELSRYTVLGETLRQLLDQSTSAMHESYATIVKVVDGMKKGCSATMVSAMYEHVSTIGRFAAHMLFAGR